MPVVAVGFFSTQHFFITSESDFFFVYNRRFFLCHVYFFRSLIAPENRELHLLQISACPQFFSHCENTNEPASLIHAGVAKIEAYVAV